MASPLFIVLFSCNTLEGFEELDTQLRVEAALRLFHETCEAGRILSVFSIA